MKNLKRAEIVLTPSNDGVSFGAVQVLYVTGTTDDPEIASKPKGFAPTLSSEQLQSIQEVWGDSLAAIFQSEGIKAEKAAAEKGSKAK